MIFHIKTDMIGVGKNNYLVLRNGMHIPKKGFVKFRKEVTEQLDKQKPKDWNPINKHGHKWDMVYVPGDNRRRDLPAILDALGHCMEKSGIVVDDQYIYNILFIRKEMSKENCGITIGVNNEEASK